MTHLVTPFETSEREGKVGQREIASVGASAKFTSPTR